MLSCLLSLSCPHFYFLYYFLNLPPSFIFIIPFIYQIPPFHPFHLLNSDSTRNHSQNKCFLNQKSTYLLALFTCISMSSYFIYFYCLVLMYCFTHIQISNKSYVNGTPQLYKEVELFI